MGRSACVFSALATLPGAAGCAEPCLDDGFGQEKCALVGSSESESSEAAASFGDASTTSGSSTATSETTAGESGSEDTAGVSATGDESSGAGSTDGTSGSDIPQTWCLDGDDDGFGDPMQCQDADDPPGPDWVPNGGDCDDADPLVVVGCMSCRPGAQCVMDELHTCNQNGTFTFVEPCELGCDPMTLQCNVPPLDLGSCAVVGFDVDEGPDPASWEIEPPGTRACETENAQPSALVCDVVLDDGVATGRFAVETGQDDDSIGLVFGWQDLGHFYLFSWKQNGQNLPGCGFLPAGMTVKRIDTDGAPGCPDLLDDTDTVASVALATPATFHDQGWENHEAYRFELHQSPTDFTIAVFRAADLSLVASTTIVDAAYPSGRLGPFAFSQVDACFEDFTVPAP